MPKIKAETKKTSLNGKKPLAEKLIIIHFEDMGQSYVRWHVNEKGVVVKSEPFQTLVWKGAQITGFDKLKEGQRVDITHMGRHSSIPFLITKIEKP